MRGHTRMPVREREIIINRRRPPQGPAPTPARPRTGWIVLGIVAVAVAVGWAMVRTAKAASPSRNAAAAEPSLVSLRVRDLPVKDAYLEVAKASGVRVESASGWPGPDRRVSLSLMREPFWEAMARIGDASGMHVQYVRRAPEQQVLLTSVKNFGDYQPVARCADGLFLATLLDHVPLADRKRPVDPTRKFASFLSISLLPEPKLRPLLWHSINVEEFVDETGRSIVPGKYPRWTPFPRNDGFLPLNLPERPWPRKIGGLRITSKVLAAAGTETAVVTDLMNGTSPTVTAAGFTIQTTSRDLAGGRRLITMNLTRIGNSTPDWLRPQQRLDLLEPIVLDRDGRVVNFFVRDRDWFGKACRVEVETIPSTRNARSSRAAGAPHKLLMEIPTDVVEYDVRLEFKDVTLF